MSYLRCKRRVCGGRTIFLNPEIQSRFFLSGFQTLFYRGGSRAAPGYLLSFFSRKKCGIPIPPSPNLPLSFKFIGDYEMTYGQNGAGVESCVRIDVVGFFGCEIRF